MAQDNDRDFGLSPEIERLSAQLARDPNSKLFIPLAEEYMKADMAVEAVMTLEEGLRAHPAYMSARVLLGKAHLMSGDMDKACEQFEKVIKAVPDNLFALKKLGEIYLAQGKSEESLKNFRILALLSPKDEELSSLISQLEAGELPSSPLSIPSPAPETAPAEEAAGPAGEKAVMEAAAEKEAAKDAAHVEEVAKDTAPAEEAAGEAATSEETVEKNATAEEAGFDAGEEGEEPLEGQAPVYEIGDEEIAELGLESVPEAGGLEPEQAGQDDIFDVPEPESAEPSPLDLGDEVPYHVGDSEALDFDKFVPGEDEPAPAAGLRIGEMGDEEEATAKQGPSGELDDIFASFGADIEQEGTSEPDAGVYEIEAPSDTDLGDLGVKTGMSLPDVSGEPKQEDAHDMPFELDDDAGETTPSDSIFDLSDVGLEESPFEDASAEVGKGEDLPFDIMEAEESGPEEMPFDAAGALDAEAEQEIRAETETADASPFGMEETESFEPGDAFGDFEAGPIPAERQPGEAQPQSQEPIKTETLAEMYIRQGFYDRAINIYKELLRESPGDTTLRQKLEELYMLAGLDSERSASESAAVSSGETAPVKPADFVVEARKEDEQAAEAGDIPAQEQYTPETEEAHAHEPPAAPQAGGGEEVIGQLEEFLENIRRKGRQ